MYKLLLILLTHTFVAQTHDVKDEVIFTTTLKSDLSLLQCAKELDRTRATQQLASFYSISMSTPDVTYNSIITCAKDTTP